MLRTAPVADIRTAYRKLVLTCHPDKVQDPTLKAKKLEEFQKLQHAYELLSDEKERLKYDEQVKLMELRKEVSKNMANTSAPRTPRTYNVSIRTEAPRSSPYAQSPPQAGSRLYAQYAHSPKEEFMFDEGRSAKRTPGYDKRSSRKEKEFDEDRERERHRRRREKEKEEEREEREIDRERERERERRSNDKETRKAEKKRQDKERKHAQDEKRRHASPAYVEEYSGDGDTPKSEKKKSSRKHRERERESTPRVEELTDHTYTRLSAASSYIQSRRMPPRASTFDTLRSSPPSVPTPPPPKDSAYTAPPGLDDSDNDDDSDEEVVHRSRATPRRDSYDPPRSKDRPFAQKRSFPSVADESIRMSTSPSHLAAMAAESPPRGSLPRSGTFHESSHRVRPGPHPVRANTFSGETPEARISRGRSRSRYHSQVPEMDEEEDEDELRQQQARKHRSSRRDPPSDPIAIPRGSHSYYGGDVRSLGREYRPSYEARSKTYISSSGSSGYAVEPGFSRSGAHFPRVKTTKRYGADDVVFSRYGSNHEVGV